VRCRTGIISQEPEYLSGPPHSVAVALCATPARLTKTRLQQKLLRKKKNESWTMRLFENIRSLTSPTLWELEETCYAKSFSLVFSG